MQFVLIEKVCYIASWKGGDSIVNLIDYKFKCLYDLKVDKKYAVKFEKLEKGKKISILSDTMLKAMFQNENRIKYSAKFLSYFIDVDYEVILNNIELGKNELDKEKEFDKALRCDYIARLDDTLLNILVDNKIASSRREAREFLSSNSIVVNGEKINDENTIINKDMLLHGKYLVIRKGKKKYFIGK